MNGIIFLSAELIVAILAFAGGRYLLPKAEKMDVKEELETLSGWAEKFVSWAREFMKSAKGPDKMGAVVQQLKQIANKAGITVTDEQLRAIAQTAYDEAKAGWNAAQEIENAIPLEAIQPPAPIVNVYTNGTGTTAVATDNVPDGALEVNEDGTINAYDKNGEKCGTVTPEEVKEAMEAVTEVTVEITDQTEATEPAQMDAE